MHTRRERPCDRASKPSSRPLRRSRRLPAAVNRFSSSPSPLRRFWHLGLGVARRPLDFDNQRRLDIRLSRAFRVAERDRLELIVTALNLLNAGTATDVSTGNVSSRNFGAPSRHGASLWVVESPGNAAAETRPGVDDGHETRARGTPVLETRMGGGSRPFSTGAKLPGSLRAAARRAAVRALVAAPAPDHDRPAGRAGGRVLLVPQCGVVVGRAGRPRR